VKKKSLPKDIIDQWPEVLSEIDVQAIPLSYLHSMRITFKDGKIWDLDIAKYTKKTKIDDLDEHIAELLDNYEESIENIDFRLDVEKVKKDVIKKTNNFLKKPTQQKK
jgi:hypothetical protein